MEFAYQLSTACHCLQSRVQLTLCARLHPTLRLPLLRYASLINGTNQANGDGKDKDGLLAWQRVLRAQSFANEGRPVRTGPVPQSVADKPDPDVQGMER